MESVLLSETLFLFTLNSLLKTKYDKRLFPFYNGNYVIQTKNYRFDRNLTPRL